MIYVYSNCCGQPRERVCSLAQYMEDPSYRCPDCGMLLPQIITPSRLFTRKDFTPFRSPVDGSVISSYSELAEHNKRNNVVNVHDGYDDKAVKEFIKKDWHTTPEKERMQDLNKDMEQAIQKLEEGYKPTPAPYTEEFPDA